METFLNAQLLPTYVASVMFIVVALVVGVLKMDVDTDSGHILVGVGLLTVYLSCKGVDLNSGTTELLTLLIGLSLRDALKKVGDSPAKQ
jgi:hypothetical protein